MDFKVAGTRQGITALQMDIKVTGISQQILREALAQAHKGRMEILDNMETAISEPRPEVSKWAPKMDHLTIPVDKIRIVIGKGGEQIDKIIEECDNVKIDINDDGKCVIYHTDREMINKAKQIILDLIREAKIDEVYDATVSEVRESFAFVTLFPGTDALLHVSEISWDRVEKIGDVLHVGDTIKVKVIAIDEAGKVKVSAKRCTEKPEGYVEPKKGGSRPSNRSGQSHRSNFEKSSGNVERRVFKKKDSE
jgi:polyribonucleotide nucleotidyltransferase